MFQGNDAVWPGRLKWLMDGGGEQGWSRGWWDTRRGCCSRRSFGLSPGALQWWRSGLWMTLQWVGGGWWGGGPDRLIGSLSRNVPEPAWSFTKGGLGWQSITSPSPELHHTPSLWTDTRTDDISSPLICPWPSVSYVSTSVLVLFLFFLFLREPGHSVDSEDNWRTCSVIKWQFVYFCKVSFGLSEESCNQESWVFGLRTVGLSSCPFLTFSLSCRRDGFQRKIRAELFYCRGREKWNDFRDIYCTFSANQHVPWWNKVLVTCHGGWNWWIEQNWIIYTPVQQSCSDWLVSMPLF